MNNIITLKAGSIRQQDAYDSLIKLNILDDLRDYSATLAGTIPLGIDLIDSDLDIICEVKEILKFQELIDRKYGQFEGYRRSQILVKDCQSFVANFKAFNFEFEIFAQDRPVEKQHAVVHMIVEKRLLELAGNHAQKQIQKLKENGLKTEPAFCEYFKIDGDPYDELIKLSESSDSELQSIVDKLKRS